MRRSPHRSPQELAALDAARADPVRQLAEVSAQHKAIRAMPDGADREQARKTLNEQGNKLANEAVRAELLRAIYSPRNCKRRWSGSGSTISACISARRICAGWSPTTRIARSGRMRSANSRISCSRPSSIRRCCQYLDNNQNAAGHVNENYARELMELHTLGVNAGYTQQDVQQLARILTGSGVNVGNPPRLKAEWQKLYRRDGAFEFNPARHDFGTKVLLGRTIEGRGFAEVDEAVSLIVKQPACARFISREIATYFVADDPPRALVERMAQTFSAHRRRTSRPCCARCSSRRSSMPRSAANSRIRCVS